MNCYVLTGGESRRMGSPKQALLLDGQTFFERVLRAIEPVFEAVFEITRSGKAPAAEVPTVYEPPHDGTSALFGIAAALDHARAPAWIVATDYPMLSEPLLRLLRERFENSSADVLVPYWDGAPQMLCAGYRPDVLPALRRRLAAGDLRLRGLIAEVSIEEVPETELRARFAGEPLANVNRPEDFEKIRRTHGG